MAHNHAWHACKHGYIITRCRCIEGGNNIIRDAKCPVNIAHHDVLVKAMEKSIETAEVKNHATYIEQYLRAWKDDLDQLIIRTNASAVGAPFSDYFLGEMKVIEHLLEKFFDS